MKKKIKYLIMFLFVVNGFVVCNRNPQFGFFWWTGIINIAGFGGLLLHKLFDYLDN